MKYYTEALMNEVKQKKRFTSFFLGDSRRTCYYQATHRENGTYLLWIEGMNWGKVITYPCVLIQGSDTLVFENGNLDISKQNNQQLVERWEAAARPDTFRAEYEVTTLEKQEFNSIFSRYRKQHLDWAIAQAEEEARREEEAQAAEQGDNEQA